MSSISKSWVSALVVMVMVMMVMVVFLVIGVMVVDDGFFQWLCCWNR